MSKIISAQIRGTVRDLTIAPGASLDITNNTLYIDWLNNAGDPDPALPASSRLVVSGFNHGGFDGPGLISSTAANDPTGTTTLGYLDSGVNPDLGDPGVISTARASRSATPTSATPTLMAKSTQRTSRTSSTA